MVTVTTSGPVTLMVSMLVRADPVSREAFCASKLVAMAAPSQGVPSWKLTLGRMVTVHTE